MTDTALTIRPAHDNDAVAIHSLAALDSSLPPTGNVLVGEVGGELWAALDIDSGVAVADPFRRSGEVVELLKVHAAGERRPQRRPLARLLARSA